MGEIKATPSTRSPKVDCDPSLTASGVISDDYRRAGKESQQREGEIPDAQPNPRFWGEIEDDQGGPPVIGHV